MPGDQPGVLPPLYQSWIDELLDGPIPEEREATCDDCAMLARPGEQAVGSGFTFDADCKCCTYVPDLANFLVGRILADDDPAFADGRATLEQRLNERVAMSPLGLDRSPTYQATVSQDSVVLESKRRFATSPGAAAPRPAAASPRIENNRR